MDKVVMDGDARTAAVRSLARLSESSDYRDRAVAGIGLASFAGLAAADDALRRLVLDPEDTHVTSEMTFSLARFADRDAGLAVVASAFHSADEDQANWIESGLEDALSFDPTPGCNRGSSPCDRSRGSARPLRPVGTEQGWRVESRVGRPVRQTWIDRYPAPVMDVQARAVGGGMAGAARRAHPTQGDRNRGVGGRAHWVGSRGRRGLGVGQQTGTCSWWVDEGRPPCPSPSPSR